MADPQANPETVAKPPAKKVKPVHVEPPVDTTQTEWLPFIEFNFPPFALAQDHNRRIILAGGGGPGRTGVPNKLVINKHREGQIKRVCLFDTNDHAITNLAIHPQEDLLACGVQDKCRIYSIGHRGFTQINEITTDFTEQAEDRGQKRVRFMPLGTCIATSGADGFVRLWSFPDLELLKEYPAFVDAKDKETVDLAVTNTLLVTTTRACCKIFNIQTEKLLHTIHPTKGMFFRDSRFSPAINDSPGDLAAQQDLKEDPDADLGFHSLIPPSPDAKYLYTAEFKPKFMSVVRKWDTTTWKCTRTATLRFTGDHHTAFSISPSGNLLAVGTVEGNIRVLDAHTLGEVMRSSTHEFFITDFVFEEPLHKEESETNSNKKHNNSSNTTRLISCSGDNTIRSTLIKNNSSAMKSFFKNLFILLLIIGLLSGLVLLATIYLPEETKQIVDKSKEYLGDYEETIIHLRNVLEEKGSQVWDMLHNYVSDFLGSKIAVNPKDVKDAL